MLEKTLEQRIADKQDILAFDAEPTADSTNPVTSGGIYLAINGYDGHLTPIATHSGLVRHLSGASSTEYGYWYSFSSAGYISYIYDVSEYVGEEIKIQYYKRANSVSWCFVTDWESIPSSKDLEAFNAIKIAWHYSTSTSGTLASYTYTVPTGAVHLVVSGKPSVLPNAIIPSISTPPSWQKDTVPFSYVDDEKERILNLIETHNRKDIAVIGFNTDQHIRQTNRETYTDPVTRGLNALRDMAETIPFSVICLGGDASGYSTEDLQSEVDADVCDVISAVDTHACPVFFITGNHDAGQNLSPQWNAADGYSMFNTALKRNVVRRQVDGFDTRSTNCWYDDNASKIRFIFMDAWARAGGPKTGGGKTYTALVRVLNEALDDEKLYGGDWSVIIFSHNVFTADVTGNTYDPPSSSYDYWNSIVVPKINENGLKVIACFNGHSHKDTQGVKDGTLFICSQQAAVQESNQSFDGITYSRPYLSSEETSYDVFVVDKTSQKIYAYKYGAGMDRLFYYGTNPRIALCSLSGTVTVDGDPAEGTIFARHHNTEYSCDLENGAYTFPYLCPECTWELQFDDYTEDYTAVEGNQTKNISITS